MPSVSGINDGGREPCPTPASSRDRDLWFLFLEDESGEKKKNPPRQLRRRLRGGCGYCRG